MLVIGVLAHSIAFAVAGDFVKGFSALLAILLCLFTPWTAINLVDFYFVRKTHYSIREIFNPHGLYGRWNWRGLSAYNTELYEGPIARALHGADVSMPVGLCVSASLYLLSYRTVDVRRELQLAALADHTLDAGCRP